MPSATAELHQLTRASLPFVRAIGSGDLESATACFAKDGCLITPEATAVHGRDRIRPVLAQMVAQRLAIEVELSNAVATGDVVLLHERWRISSAGPEGTGVARRVNPTLVLRRIEGEWKLAIAAPWGRAQPHH